MKQGKLKKFQKERERLNRIVMKYGGTNIKRFYSIDSQVYEAGTLPKKTKELLGLACSLVLRCDDCVKYHIIECKKEGVGDKEFEEALSIALVVGGSIVIPHLRRAFEAWEEVKR
ncbi:MAG: carboxymuconolactone decarboxylase family protein [candidate division Zixibacteria bacterium]|nr:carboxymuconolactone decarboxylase family protein [candidate division Zixibacteria bacterium]